MTPNPPFPSPNPPQSGSAPAGATPASSVASAVHASLMNQSPQTLAQQLQTQMQSMQMQAMMQLQAHGPFPPPAVVKEYELILPGTFERIVKMAEKAQQDQTDTVRFAQESQRRDTARVHWMAIGVSVTAMLGATFCAWIHQPVVAGLFLGVPVFAVAKAFIDSLKAPNPNQQAQLPRQQPGGGGQP